MRDSASGPYAASIWPSQTTEAAYNHDMSENTEPTEAREKASIIIVSDFV
jgi:hypothetical protein